MSKLIPSLGHSAKLKSDENLKLLPTLSIYRYQPKDDDITNTLGNTDLVQSNKDAWVQGIGGSSGRATFG